MTATFGYFFWPDCDDVNMTLTKMLDGGSPSGLQAVAEHLLRVRPRGSFGIEESGVPEHYQKAWLIKAQGLLAYKRQHPYAKIAKGHQELWQTLAEVNAAEQGLAKLSAAPQGLFPCSQVPWLCFYTPGVELISSSSCRHIKQ